MGESFKVDRLHVLKDVLRDKLDTAKEKLDRLDDLYPKEPELAYYHAAYYRKVGNRNMANQYLDKAINFGSACTYCTPELYKETKRPKSVFLGSYQKHRMGFLLILVTYGQPKYLSLKENT